MERTVAILATLILSAAPAAADIVPCNAVTAERGPKIILDQIVGSDQAAQNLLQALTSRLDANLTQVQAELGLPDLKVLPCQNRSPSGPSDFNRRLVQELDVRGVMLEVWGAATRMIDASGKPFHEASIGYMLVPVRLNEFQAQQPRGAFTIAHRADAVLAVDDLLRLVDQAGRLSAYAALAAGSNTIREGKNWGAARSQLCKAQSLFAMLKQPLDPGDAALAEYTKKLAADAISGAHGDPRYTGTLKQQPVNLPCGGK